MNPLASTTFSSGPSDSLAAVDVYSTSGKNVINSIVDKKDSGLGFDISKLLANGGKGSIGSAGSLLSMTKTGGLGLNTNDITGRLLKAAPGIGSSLRDMSDKAKAGIMDKFKDSGTMDFKMGADTFKVPSSNFADMTAFSSYATDVNAYSFNLTSLNANTDGTCYAYDVDAHAAMLSGGITQGSNLGIPKSYDFFTKASSSVTDNKELLTKVAAAAGPILAKNGDLGNLAQLTQGGGGQVLSAVLPSYGNTLKQNYSYGNYGRNTGAQVNDYTNLISIFTNTDSKWNIIDRIGDATGTTGTTTFNLLRVLGGSREFQELIAIGVKNMVEGDRNKVQGLAAMFGETTVDAQLKINFPRLWQESYNNPVVTRRNRTLDPRVVSTIGQVAGFFSSNDRDNRRNQGNQNNWLTNSGDFGF